MAPEGKEAELDQWASQLRKGTLVLGVLLLLRGERRYGLELIEELERATGLEISEGTIYPLLSRLHRQGWLSAEWETETAGHPRKYYRLTPKGEAYLQEMIARWRAFSQGLNELIQQEPGREGEPYARERSGNREEAGSRGREAAPGLPEPA